MLGTPPFIPVKLDRHSDDVPGVELDLEVVASRQLTQLGVLALAARASL
jgi:hypothetical protein